MRFIHLGLALGMSLKFYTSVVKELKSKVRKFYGRNHTLVKVTRKKLVRGFFCSPPILNRIRKILLTEQNCTEPSVK